MFGMSPSPISPPTTCRCDAENVPRKGDDQMTILSVKTVNPACWRGCFSAVFTLTRVNADSGLGSSDRLLSNTPDYGQSLPRSASFRIGLASAVLIDRGLLLSNESLLTVFGRIYAAPERVTSQRTEAPFDGHAGEGWTAVPFPSTKFTRNPIGQPRGASLQRCRSMRHISSSVTGRG